MYKKMNIECIMISINNYNLYHTTFIMSKFSKLNASVGFYPHYKASTGPSNYEILQSILPFAGDLPDQIVLNDPSLDEIMREGILAFFRLGTEYYVSYAILKHMEKEWIYVDQRFIYVKCDIDKFIEVRNHMELQKRNKSMRKKSTGILGRVRNLLR